jgi:hypothetical protein
MKTSSIKFRLNVLFVVIISVLLLAFGAINYVTTQGKLEAAMAQQVDATLGRLSASLPGSIWNFDKAQIEQGLNAEMGATFIAGIIIKNGDKLVGGAMRGADGKPAAATQPPASDFSKAVDLTYLDFAYRIPGQLAGGNRRFHGGGAITVKQNAENAQMAKRMVGTAAAGSMQSQASQLADAVSVFKLGNRTGLLALR